MTILQKAVDELKAAGIVDASATVVAEPTTIRGWAGQTTNVDAAIKMPNHRYDVGFRRDANGVLKPFMEDMFHDHGFRPQFGAKSIEDKPIYGAELGLLQQRYALINAEQNANRMGTMTRRVEGANGQIMLEVIT